MAKIDYEGITSERTTNNNGVDVFINNITRTASAKSFYDSMKALGDEAGQLFVIAYFAQGIETGAFVRAMLNLAKSKNRKELQSSGLNRKIKKAIIVAPESTLLLQWIRGITTYLDMNIVLVKTMEEAKEIAGLGAALDNKPNEFKK